MKETCDANVSFRKSFSHFRENSLLIIIISLQEMQQNFLYVSNSIFLKFYSRPREKMILFADNLFLLPSYVIRE